MPKGTPLDSDILRHIPPAPRFAGTSAQPYEIAEFLALWLGPLVSQKMDWGRFWRRSVACAEASADWALRFGLSNRTAEAAYLAGLLHDIAHPVLAANAPVEWSRLMGQCRFSGAPVRRYEERVLGGRHDVRGGHICRHWGIQESVVQAVEGHHRPPSHKDWDTTACVFFGEAVAGLVTPAPVEGLLPEWTESTLAEYAGVRRLQVRAVMRAVEKRLKSPHRLLHVMPEARRAGACAEPRGLPVGRRAAQSILETLGRSDLRSKAKEPGFGPAAAMRELRRLMPPGRPQFDCLLYQHEEGEPWHAFGAPSFPLSALEEAVSPCHLPIGVPIPVPVKIPGGGDVLAVRLPPFLVCHVVYVAGFNFDVDPQEDQLTSGDAALEAAAAMAGFFASRRYVKCFGRALGRLSPGAYEHSLRVARAAEGVCRAFGLDVEQTDRIVAAAELHELGRIGLPPDLETSARLSGETPELQVHANPARGYRIIRAALPDVAPAIAAHREMLDGSGYPVGMRGVQIPIEARIVAACDTYETLKDAAGEQEHARDAEARETLKAMKGAALDPDAVDALLKCDEDRAA
ncbi:MAG: HDOD domain-containing protein [Armatimonadetes bacterium]|nr:HDOD domain-containing protein [Armatimonadota bacterium]